MRTLQKNFRGHLQPRQRHNRAILHPGGLILDALTGYFGPSDQFFDLFLGQGTHKLPPQTPPGGG